MEENWILKWEGLAKSDGEKSEFGRGTPWMGEIRSFPYSTSLPPLILKFDFLPFFGLYSQADNETINVEWNDQRDHKDQD